MKPQTKAPHRKFPDRNKLCKGCGLHHLHHQTRVFIPGLGEEACVDTGIVDVVSEFNKIPGITTIYSCQECNGRTPAICQVTFSGVHSNELQNYLFSKYFELGAGPEGSRWMGFGWNRFGWCYIDFSPQHRYQIMLILKMFKPTLQIPDREAKPDRLLIHELKATMGQVHELELPPYTI